MKRQNAFSEVMKAVREKGQGVFFEVGRIGSYDAKTHTASVEVPAMELILDSVRIGTPRVGTRFNLKSGQECLVIFREGDPMNSEPVAYPMFYSTKAPPAPDLEKAALYGGEEFVHESETGARDECYDYARRFLYAFIELGALATYGALLGEPCATSFNTHVHTIFVGFPSTSPPLPVFSWYPVSHISQTVKVQP